MGDRIGVQLPVREIYLGLTNHPDQLSLAIPAWVCTMSTGQRNIYQLQDAIFLVAVQLSYKTKFTSFSFFVPSFLHGSDLAPNIVLNTSCQRVGNFSQSNNNNSN